MASNIYERYRTVGGDLSSIRIGYVVSGIKDEYEATTVTRVNAPVVIPLVPPGGNPDSVPHSVPKNARWYRWNIGVEEVSQFDQDRAVANSNAVYFTFVEYRPRAICPQMQYEFSTQTETVYEGVTDPIQTVVRDQANQGTINAIIGINEDRQGASYSVRGTNRVVPVGRITVLWQPMTQEEVNKVYLEPTGASYMDVTAEYMRRTAGLVGKVHGSPGFVSPTPPTNVRFLDAWNNGEVLFTAFSGRIVSETLQIYELRYTFDVMENKTDLTIDGLDLGDVEAFDHVWGQRRTTKDTTSTNREYHYSRYAFLRQERIYGREDLNALFFNSSGQNMVTNCPYFTTWDTNNDAGGGTAMPVSYPNWSTPTIPPWPTP